jgi:PAS domain S-box-containing protein
VSDAKKTKAELVRELEALRAELARTRGPRSMTSSGSALGDDADRYRVLIENMRAIVIESRKGVIQYVSPSAIEVLGRTPEELIGKRPSELIDADYDTAALDQIRQRAVSTGAAEGLLRARKGRDQWIWLDTAVRRFSAPDGDRMVILMRDATERVVAQQALEQNEQRYRLLFEIAGYIVSEIDQDGRLIYLSPNYEQVMGIPREQVLGTNFVFRMHPDDAISRVDGFLQHINHDAPMAIPPHRVLRIDGSVCWMEGVAISYERDGHKRTRLAMVRDVTERIEAEERRKQFEERLHQAQRLEGLGVMAGGIAHDFNNLLTPILGDTSLALLDLPPSSPLRERLQRVQRAAHRAAALTNQMLSYAGEDSLQVEILNLSRLVKEIATLLETAAARHATLIYDLASHLPAVEADSARLSQVIMNLITNASEALEERGGRIALRTGTATLTREELDTLILGNAITPGSYAYLEVEDSGKGMDAETQSRIFDPFFTTKLTGRGLGLAAVLGIVRSHAGAIDLDSEIGRGTRFRVYFPAASRYLAGAPKLTTDAAAGEASRATVLVVDDEADVRALASDVLERAGLTVLTANDGHEAIQVFSKRRGEISVVLLDRTMPGLTGDEAFGKIRALDAKARIVLMSGFSEQRAARAFGDQKIDGFLQKPFLPAALLSIVRAALERPAS